MFGFGSKVTEEEVKAQILAECHEDAQELVNTVFDPGHGDLNEQHVRILPFNGNVIITVEEADKIMFSINTDIFDTAVAHLVVCMQSGEVITTLPTGRVLSRIFLTEEQFVFLFEHIRGYMGNHPDIFNDWINSNVFLTTSLAPIGIPDENKNVDTENKKKN